MTPFFTQTDNLSILYHKVGHKATLPRLVLRFFDSRHTSPFWFLTQPSAGLGECLEICFAVLQQPFARFQLLPILSDSVVVAV